MTTTFHRPDDRQPDQTRPIKITTAVNRYAEGSCLIEFGNTHVLCLASVEERVPPHLRDKAEGWVTAEYSMLPRATHTRGVREAAKGKQGGRTMEIQRLIGRSLRAVVDTRRLGERSITVDCDVLQADGGTRTAAITGGWVAMTLAVRALERAGKIGAGVVKDHVAAVSVGIVQGLPVLDLCYDEDSAAEVDLNLVMTGAGSFVEIQGTAEGVPFGDDHLAEMIRLGRAGIAELVAAQRVAIG